MSSGDHPRKRNPHENKGNLAVGRVLHRSRVRRPQIDGRSSTGRRPRLWSQRTVTTSPTVRCPGADHVGVHGRQHARGSAPSALSHGSRRGHAVLGEVDHAAAFEPPVDRQLDGPDPETSPRPRSPPRTARPSPAPGWSARGGGRRRRRARARTTRAVAVPTRDTGPSSKCGTSASASTRTGSPNARDSSASRSSSPTTQRRPVAADLHPPVGRRARRRTRRPRRVAGTAGCPSRRRTCRRRPPRRTAGRPPGRERRARRAPGSRRPSTSRGIGGWRRR